MGINKNKKAVLRCLCRYLLTSFCDCVMWKVASGDEVYEKEISFIYFFFFVKFIVVDCRALSA
jgi:hypothetical protein